jgi:4-amino-4-deoxy-L-arabinose transferase-like glycosyltransferase
MVKKVLLGAIVLLGFIAVPRPAMAGCTTNLLDCYYRAAKVDDFWYRWASGLDCELSYTDCVRRALIGR